jgi:hypothetical protein
MDVLYAMNVSKKAENKIKRLDIFLFMHRLTQHLATSSYEKKVPSHGVPVKCETKSKRNETKRNEINRNEIHRKETKFTETKRNRNVSVNFISFRFRFVSISFHILQVPHEKELFFHNWKSYYCVNAPSSVVLDFG